LPSERVPSADRPALKQLKDATWDIASYAAFWRTVQLSSLGPGLLPGLVVLLLMVPQIARGNLGPSPRPSDPFILWPSLWLLGWFALTFALAPIRHASMQRRALRLARHLGLLA
jgi:DMSO/TMAO reductase YedYZ heme-binding membrane subunit